MGRYTRNSYRLIVISTMALFLAELVIGYVGNSVTLTLDAFSVYSHLLSMIDGFSGVRLSRMHRHRRFTFGLLISSPRLQSSPSLLTLLTPAQFWPAQPAGRLLTSSPLPWLHSPVRSAIAEVEDWIAC
ncbi:Zinc transporter 10 [Acipenser ruthenus]|uniref:Zinc transporter 10 n=1 Tax=Acipenser ruthenus TaxID=7906 RepID=A0A444U0R9_ACIRT|nr:Zinc transporter 10 [Acipenser ruthenus]